MPRPAGLLVRMGFPMSNSVLPGLIRPGGCLPLTQDELTKYLRCRVDMIVDALGRALDGLNVEPGVPADTAYIEGQFARAQTWMTQCHAATILVGMAMSPAPETDDANQSLDADPFLPQNAPSANSEGGAA